MSRQNTLFHWSGGKDSMLALHWLKSSEEFQVLKLLTNFSSATGRVSMHGVRKELIEKQAESIGLPLDTMHYHTADYDKCLSKEFNQAVIDGFTTVAYGDIFLEDLKLYRDKQLADHQLAGTYPLWKKNTYELVREFVDLGYKSVIVCVNGSLLDKSFVGKTIDHDFLRSLPDNVDPCGENGEFHSFVYDGPLFTTPVNFDLGDIIGKTYPNPSETDKNEIQFWFGDLIAK